MQRAHEVLYYVGLGEARYRNVETYSTGMKQRIKLAQALVHDPDLLFLDEPTNGMDPKGRDEMLELIRDLAHNKGVNLILSSHLLPDVEYTCDHVVVLDKGAVATSGPIDAAEGTGGPRVRSPRQRRRCAPFVAALTRRRPRVPRDRRGRHARLRARARRRAPGDDQRRICEIAQQSRRAGPASARRACRRSKTCSRARLASNEPDSRSELPPLRRARAQPPGRAWTVIAWAGIRTMLARKVFLALLLARLDPVHRPHRPDLRRDDVSAGAAGAAGRRADVHAVSSSSRARSSSSSRSTSAPG